MAPPAICKKKTTWSLIHCLPILVTKWCMDYNFGHQVELLALIANLYTMRHHLHQLKIGLPSGTTCIDSKFSHQVAPLALVPKLTTRLGRPHASPVDTLQFETMHYCIVLNWTIRDQSRTWTSFYCCWYLDLISMCVTNCQKTFGKVWLHMSNKFSREFLFNLEIQTSNIHNVLIIDELYSIYSKNVFTKLCLNWKCLWIVQWILWDHSK